MHKAQARMRRAKPYAKKMLQVSGHLAQGHAEYQHPYLVEREIKRVGFIVVTTDRGLCGGLNANLLKTTLAAIQKTQEKEIEFDLCLIGSRGESFFRRVGGNVIAQATHLGDAPSLTDLIGIIKVMLDAYKDGKIDALYLCANDFINTMKQDPQVQQLLPVVPDPDASYEHYWDYIYEPDEARVILESILTRYIESQVYRGVIENIACEQAARMVAMKSATDNAGELIDELHLIYHKARQTAITQELSEIVAGSVED
jgi:F-type H+-transporting ATPase subunit gamma